MTNKEKYDVVVIGGGIATIGNVCVYLPLCDGKGNQVIGGIAEELLKLSISDGYKDIPSCWKEGGNKEERKKVRYKVEFNPLMPTFRMTRRLKGKTELKEEDEGKFFPDTVGMTGDWRKPGPVYYIPFSSLYAVKTKNLITAGRCISASSAWDITRAIPVCALTGEISGIASAFLIKENVDSFSSLNIKKLQETLKNQGIIINVMVR